MFAFVHHTQFGKLGKDSCLKQNSFYNKSPKRKRKKPYSMQHPNVQIVLIEQLKWVKPSVFLSYPLSTIHHTKLTKGSTFLPPPRNELSNVDANIACLNHTLFSPIFSPPITLAQKYVPHIAPIRTSRFSQLTSVFSISHEDSYKRENVKLGGKWGWGRYNRLDKNEEPPFIRRESGDSGHSSDSDRTLVGATADCGENVCLVQDERVHDLARELSALLAPVISTIQRLGIKISSHVHALLPAEFDACRDYSLPQSLQCDVERLEQTAIISVICQSTKKFFFGHKDGLEMRTLILEVLIKKIKAEQARFQVLANDSHIIKQPIRRACRRLSSEPRSKAKRGTCEYFPMQSD